MLQLKGTALPSLALENLQELDNLKLSGPDRDKAEKTIAGALASVYTGSYSLPRVDLAEMVLESWARYCKLTGQVHLSP